MMRRAVAVQEAVALKYISALKISESDNLADIMTKYLKLVRWRRLINKIMNITAPAKPLIVEHSNAHTRA